MVKGKCWFIVIYGTQRELQQPRAVLKSRQELLKQKNEVTESDFSKWVFCK